MPEQCVDCGSFKVAIHDHEYDEYWCGRCWWQLPESEREGAPIEFVEPD